MPLPFLRFGRSRSARRIRELSDRRLMAEAFIPELAREGGRILWVGVREYTFDDYPALEAEGAEVWTTDIDPKAARWGRKGHHRTGDVCNIDGVFSDLTFDAVVCNGVLGFGVDAPDAQVRAFGAMARILKPGGRLLLGWNTDRIDDPVAAGRASPRFEPSAFAGQPAEVRVADTTHVYSSLKRTLAPA